MPHIISLGSAAPAFHADNAHVRDLVLRHSASCWQGDLQDLGRQLDKFFVKSGAKARLWRESARAPIAYLSEAVAECLDTAPPGGADRIGCLIYCAVDKSIAEPAHASVAAAALGLPAVRSFDVSDACMGWFTAVRAARPFVDRNKPFALILSAEFPLEPNAKIVPAALTIESPDALRWKASALTMGEAATATLIDATAPVLPSFEVSQNDASDLCVVPLTPVDRIYGAEAAKALNGYDCFMADAVRLAQTGYRSCIGVMRDLVSAQGMPDMIIPHAFSASVPTKAVGLLDLAPALRLGFPHTGNLSTSSIPYALHAAGAEARASKTYGWIASAGMKHAAFEIGWA